MKGYENLEKGYLMLGVPHIVRLDMRAGHTFCRKFARPYDAVFAYCMEKATAYLAENVPMCRIAYTQSDEISLVLIDSFANGYNCFFDGAVEKICSITASMATLAFNKAFCEIAGKMQEDRAGALELVGASDDEVADASVYADRVFEATFDSRAFSIPNKAEVVNYLIWRVQDATRNSVNMLAQSMFSHKELQGVSLSETKVKCASAGKNWDSIVSARNKHGLFLCAADEIMESGKVKRVWDRKTPLFAAGAWYDDMARVVRMPLDAIEG